MRDAVTFAIFLLISDELPYLDVPLHTIMKMTTDGNDCTLDLIRLPVDCVDTYRQRPKVSSRLNFNRVHS